MTTTIIGIIVLVAAAVLAFRVTALAARIALGIVAFIGLLIILVPVLILSG